MEFHVTRLVYQQANAKNERKTLPHKQVVKTPFRQKERKLFMYFCIQYAKTLINLVVTSSKDDFYKHMFPS